MTWSELLRRLAGLQEGEERFAREVEIEGRWASSPCSAAWTSSSSDGRTERPGCASSNARPAEGTGLTACSSQPTVSWSPSLGKDGVVIGGKLHRNIVLESVVARIDEDTNEVQDALTAPSLDLEQEMEDLRRLLAADGPLARIDSMDLDELSYSLDPKCDACVHAPSACRRAPGSAV